MIQKIKTLILTLSLLVIPGMSLATSASVSADTSDTTIQSGLCGGADTLTLNSTNGNKCAITGKSDFTGIIATVVNVISIVVGVMAVIMIIVGGFRYTTSGGKEEGIKGAKNSIMYALIGLVVVALAQVIVRFVLTKAAPAG